MTVPTLAEWLFLLPNRLAHARDLSSESEKPSMCKHLDTKKLGMQKLGVRFDLCQNYHA